MTRRRVRVPWGAAMAALATGAASLLSVTVASASPRYPDELRSALGLSKVPACTLCHGRAASSDAGTVETPFGKSMVARGLRGEADGGVGSTLASALAAMRKDGVDSDADGAQDLDELTWGGDPNTYDGSPARELETTSYGCGLGRPSDSRVAGLAVVAMLVWRRRLTRPCR